MIRFLLLPLFVVGLIASATTGLALTLGTSGTSGGSDVSGGRATPVVLGVGDALDLPGDSVLTFVELVEDSRCPADAMCIWQGQAVLRFDLDGQRFKATYTGPDGDVPVVDGWAIQVLDVQPYPLASQPADPADTEVTVRVYRAD